MSLLAKRYARALFDAAEEKGVTEAVAADLAVIEAAFAEPQVRAMLLDPETPRATRQAALDKVIKSGHELSRNLIAVVLRRRREAVLPELNEAYAAMVREARGEVEGVAETARPLDEAQLRELEATASQLVGKKVTLRMELQPELIGGIRLHVGNTLYDGSVATALEDLERQLMDAPVP